MKRIGSKGMLAGLLLSLLLAAACDDVGRPLEDRFAPAPPPEVKKPGPTMLTREEMEADYHFILSTRASLREMAESALEAREKGDVAKFAADRALFNFQYKNWAAMIGGRKGTIDSTGETYPPEHPAAVLRLALGQLRQEMDDYYRKMNDMREANPGADAQLMDTMKQLRAALDAFTPAAGEPPIPIK